MVQEIVNALESLDRAIATYNGSRCKELLELKKARAILVVLFRSFE